MNLFFSNIYSNLYCILLLLVYNSSFFKIQKWSCDSFFLFFFMLPIPNHLKTGQNIKPGLFEPINIYVYLLLFPMIMFYIDKNVYAQRNFCLYVYRLNFHIKKTTYLIIFNKKINISSEFSSSSWIEFDKRLFFILLFEHN